MRALVLTATLLISQANLQSAHRLEPMIYNPHKIILKAVIEIHSEGMDFNPSDPLLKLVYVTENFVENITINSVKNKVKKNNIEITFNKIKNELKQEL